MLVKGATGTGNVTTVKQNTTQTYVCFMGCIYLRAKKGKRQIGSSPRRGAVVRRGFHRHADAKLNYMISTLYEINPIILALD